MRESVSSYIFEASFGTESLTSSDILAPKVSFHFTVQHQHHLVATTSEGHEMILEQISSFVEPEQVFNNVEFLCLFLPLLLHSHIHDMLTHLQIPPSDIDRLKRLISAYAYETALISKQTRSRSIDIFVHLVVLLRQDIDEEPDEAAMLMDMDGDESFSLLPPSPASIQALEIQEYDSEDSSFSNESCTICMDELVRGVNIVRLPCSHIFHDDCILKWLENKNSCPLCRFVLATQD